jgi:hypothetical protein
MEGPGLPLWSSDTPWERETTAASSWATRAIKAAMSVDEEEEPKLAGLPVMPDQGTDPAQSARVTFIARG